MGALTEVTVEMQLCCGTASMASKQTPAGGEARDVYSGRAAGQRAQCSAGSVRAARSVAYSTDAIFSRLQSDRSPSQSHLQRYFCPPVRPADKLITKYPAPRHGVPALRPRPPACAHPLPQPLGRPRRRAHRLRIRRRVMPPLSISLCRRAIFPPPPLCLPPRPRRRIRPCRSPTDANHPPARAFAPSGRARMPDDPPTEPLHAPSARTSGRKFSRTECSRLPCRRPRARALLSPLRQPHVTSAARRYSGVFRPADRRPLRQSSASVRPLSHPARARGRRRRRRSSASRAGGRRAGG